jgi:hypothetical protein
LAMFAAIRLASSLVSNLAADRRRAKLRLRCTAPNTAKKIHYTNSEVTRSSARARTVNAATPPATYLERRLSVRAFAFTSATRCFRCPS